MTASNLAEETGKSRRQVLMTLSSLQGSRRLERIGPARGSRSQSRRLAAEGVGARRHAPCYKAASEFARIRDHEDVATSKASEKTTPSEGETTLSIHETSEIISDDRSRTSVIENKTSENIVAYLRRNPKASARTMAESFGVSSRAIEYHLSALKKQGILKRAGSARSGHWIILDKENTDA